MTSRCAKEGLGVHKTSKCATAFWSGVCCYSKWFNDGRCHAGYTKVDLGRNGVCDWTKPENFLCCKTSTPVPTATPTAEPTASPTELPTTLPPTTDEPSFSPTHTPTEVPSAEPSLTPTEPPTTAPSELPTEVSIKVDIKAECDAALEHCQNWGWEVGKSMRDCSNAYRECKANGISIKQVTEPPMPDPCKASQDENKANQEVADALKAQVNFGGGSSTIKSSGKKTLDDVVIVLNTYPWMTVNVAAHSDARKGSRCTELTTSRGQAVLDYL